MLASLVRPEAHRTTPCQDLALDLARLIRPVFGKPSLLVRFSPRLLHSRSCGRQQAGRIRRSSFPERLRLERREETSSTGCWQRVDRGRQVW